MNPEAEMIVEELDEAWTKLLNIGENINKKLWIKSEPGSGTEQDYSMAEDRLIIAREMIEKARNIITYWEED